MLEHVAARLANVYEQAAEVDKTLQNKLRLQKRYDRYLASFAGDIRDAHPDFSCVPPWGMLGQMANPSMLVLEMGHCKIADSHRALHLLVATTGMNLARICFPNV